MSTELIETADHELSQMLGQASSRVLLASPYLSEFIARRIIRQVSARTPDRRLLTRLDPGAVAYGSLSVEGLEALLESGFVLRDLGDLHAKVYIGDECGLLGSANLTSAGLGISRTPNTELSVQLAAGDTNAAAVRFEHWWARARPFDRSDLTALKKLAKTAVIPPVTERRAVDGSLNVALDSLFASSAAAGLWVKGVYRDVSDADDLRELERWFGSPDKGRPSFKTGDLVILCALQADSCYVVYEVTGDTVRDVQFVLDQVGVDQWPYVTPVEVRLQVPVAEGARLATVGKNNQSLQNGHARLSRGQFNALLRELSGLSSGN